jgi:hypothetical protein
MEFEKEFDIQIPDDQAENIATVGQAIYIKKLKIIKFKTRKHIYVWVLLYFFVNIKF